ncbi:MAG: putative motility protein [Ruminococcus sp.]|jgi:hypothetical protein|nr:putative motility protein [Ruminococcus sp.]
MDIPALSSMMSMERLSTSVSFALMSKVMDTAESTSEAMLEMMDAAMVPGLGENLDIMA